MDPERRKDVNDELASKILAFLDSLVAKGAKARDVNLALEWAEAAFVVNHMYDGKQQKT